MMSRLINGCTEDTLLHGALKLLKVLRWSFQHGFEIWFSCLKCPDDITIQ